MNLLSRSLNFAPRVQAILKTVMEKEVKNG